MKKIILAIAVVLTLGFTMFSCKSDKKETKKEVEKEVVKEIEEEVVTDKDIAMATYHCTMKCEGEKTYDKAGKCPKCKMDLKEMKSDENSEDQDSDKDSGEDEN